MGPRACAVIKVSDVRLCLGITELHQAEDGRGRERFWEHSRQINSLLKNPSTCSCYDWREEWLDREAALQWSRGDLRREQLIH